MKTTDLKAHMKAGLGGLRTAKKQGLFEPTTPVESDPFPVVEVLPPQSEDNTQRHGAVTAPQPQVSAEHDQRMTVPMTLEQRKVLRNIEDYCLANKLKKSHRLTGNNAIRGLLDRLKGISQEDFIHVSSDEDLVDVLVQHLCKSNGLPRA